MRVFVTGATGFVGSAVVPELIAARPPGAGPGPLEAGVRALEAAGAKRCAATSSDQDGLARAAASADAVIHTAFNHDFSRFAENCELDRRAIEALGAELEGSDKPLLVTSGTARLASGGWRSKPTCPRKGWAAIPASRKRPPRAFWPRASAPRSCGCSPPPTARATTASCRC